MEESNSQPEPLQYAAPFTSPAAPLAEPRLTPEHLRQLADAKIALKKIRRAVSVARFDGWSIAIFAAVSLVVGYSSFWGLFIGTVMGVIAFVELRSADKLAKLEISSIKILSLNQLALASLLIVYAVWSLCTFDASSSSVGSALAQLGVSGKDVADTVRKMIEILYVGVIMVAIFAQGGLALYYFRRQKLLRDYLKATPKWIVAMQRQGIAN